MQEYVILRLVVLFCASDLVIKDKLTQSLPQDLVHLTHFNNQFSGYYDYWDFLS